MQILVLEDEPLIAMMLGDWLEELGQTVAGPVATAAAALAAIEAGGIEAALLDLHLRDGDSYAVAERLRARGLPYAFSSGAGRDGLAEPFRDDPLLAKPFEFASVAALVRRWNDRAAAIRSA